MHDFSSATSQHRAAGQSRAHAEQWVAGFAVTLHSCDTGRIGACSHEDCHWRDAVAARLASAQERTFSRSLQIPTGRPPPREVTRLGIANSETIFAVRRALGQEIADRIGPAWDIDDDGELGKLGPL